MSSRNLELDRLRAFAILLTLNIHITRAFFPWSMFSAYRTDGTVLNILNNSWSGVDLFLVISGFIISRTIVRKLDQLREGSARAAFVKAFYVRRLFRIYPVAWVVFFLVVALGCLFNATGYFGSVTSNVQAGISIFTYTYNYLAFGECLRHPCPLAPYWSLSLEEQFYLMLPLFLLLTQTTRQRVWILSGLLLAITLIARPLSHDDVRIFYMYNRGDGLLYGCLLYFMTEQPWFKAIRISSVRSPALASAATLILVLVLAGIPGVGFSSSIAVPAVCVTACVLVFLAACQAGVITFPRPIERALDYLGSRSYSFYLVHMPMLTVTQELMFRFVGGHAETLGPRFTLAYLAIGLGLTLIVTEIIYRSVEMPLLEKGKKVSERILSAHGAAQIRHARSTARHPELEAESGVLVE